MFWTSHHGLFHVSILYRYDPRLTLFAGNLTSAPLESAMWHTRLLSTVKYDCNSVTFRVFVKNASDNDATSVALRLAENASRTLACTLTSPHSKSPSQRTLRYEQCGVLPPPFKPADAQLDNLRPLICVNIGNIQPFHITIY